MSYKPYHRPPLSEHGAENYDDIYKAVGEGLSAWETYESSLIYLFSLLMNAHVLSSRLIFGSILSSSARSELVAAAASAYLYNYPEKMSEIKKRLNENRKFTGLRNDLAHGVVYQTEKGKCYLFPAEYATSKHEHNIPFLGQPTYRYSDTEIKEITSKFRVIHHEVWAIIREIREWTLTVPPETIPPLSVHKEQIPILDTRSHKD